MTALEIKTFRFVCLPITNKELKICGWDLLDVILFSGNIYVGYPSFGPGELFKEQGPIVMSLDTLLKVLFFNI